MPTGVYKREPKSDHKRFLKFVEIGHEDECWLWKGSITKKTGYGRFRLNGDSMTAHRAAYILFVREVPGLDVHHICEQRRCVNWKKHLTPATHKEHMADLTPHSIPYKNKRKTHCPRGHVYDEQNTGFYEGRRFCKTCLALKNRARFHPEVRKFCESIGLPLSTKKK